MAAAHSACCGCATRTSSARPEPPCAICDAARRAGREQPDSQDGTGHSLSGNPMRFERGPLVVRPDTEWQQGCRARPRLVTALTAAAAASLRLPLYHRQEEHRVTGARRRHRVAGFIGSHLTEAALAAGDKVVGIDALTDYYDIAAQAGESRPAAAPTGGSRFVEADLQTADLEAAARRRRRRVPPGRPAGRAPVVVDRFRRLRRAQRDRHPAVAGGGRHDASGALRLRLLVLGLRQCRGLPDRRAGAAAAAQPLRRHQARRRAPVPACTRPTAASARRRCATSPSTGRGSARTWGSTVPRRPRCRRGRCRSTATASRCATSPTSADVVAANLARRPQRRTARYGVNVAGGGCGHRQRSCCSCSAEIVGHELRIERLARAAGRCPGHRRHDRPGARAAGLAAADRSAHGTHRRARLAARAPLRCRRLHCRHSRLLTRPAGPTSGRDAAFALMWDAMAPPGRWLATCYCGVTGRAPAAGRAVVLTWSGPSALTICRFGLREVRVKS